jgi:heat shock protein HtpX
MGAPTEGPRRSVVAERRAAEGSRAADRRDGQLGEERRRMGQQRANRRRAGLLAAGPAILVGLIAFGLTWAASSVWPAVVVGAVGGFLTAVGIIRQSGPLTLRLLGAAPAADTAQPRVHNLIEGLCAGAGVARPEVWVLDSDVANSLVVAANPRRSCLVVTTGLVSRLSRVELEATLAHQIAKLRSGDAFPATVAVVTGLALPRRTRAARTAVAQARADLAALTLTCYPPGLAAALEALADQLPVTGLAARLTEHLWLASPSAPVGPRAAELRDL